jgi:RpiR family carbohydrate utilization transcriptional regulator
MIHYITLYPFYANIISYSVVIYDIFIYIFKILFDDKLMMVEKEENIGGCLVRMDGLYISLKRAEKRLADYIFAHPQEVCKTSIQSLQEKSDVGYATIIRFCKKAGYHGYKAFKRSLAYDLKHEKKSMTAPVESSIQHEDSIDTIIHKTFDSSNNILEETRSMLDTESIYSVVDKLLSAGEIYFIGTGMSGVSARYASTRFFRLGLPCSAESDATLYKIKSSLLQESDILFAISSSGRSLNIVDAARIARDTGVTVVAMTDFAISPLSRIAKINLYTTPRNTRLFLHLDMPLIIGQINILDVLFFACCARMGQRSADIINATKLIADGEKIK